MANAPKILILGGTHEARALAAQVADAGFNAVFSYAGRVADLAEQAVPVRVGGFGGAGGLADYLTREAITHVIDATHPFAAQMSRNAVAASARLNLPLIALTRAPWVVGDGDNWFGVRDVAAAASALDGPAKRVFLAIGRQTLDAFATQPQHHYLLRLVDAPTETLPLPNASVVLARGPFKTAGDLALLQEYRIDLIVSKNAGGDAARAKLDAARALGLPVIMIDRPAMPKRSETHDIDAVMRWCHDETDLGV